MAKARAAVSAAARDLWIFLKVSKCVLSVLSKTQLRCESCPLETGAGWSGWSRSKSVTCEKERSHKPRWPSRRNRSYVQSMREQLRGGKVGDFIESP